MKKLVYKAVIEFELHQDCREELEKIINECDPEVAKQVLEKAREIIDNDTLKEWTYNRIGREKESIKGFRINSELEVVEKEGN